MERTVQEVIEAIVAAVPGAPFPETVDTMKVGDPHQKVTGIVVTFLATYHVIEQAIQHGANLIITHEPTFYNHADEIRWLGGDHVYEASGAYSKSTRWPSGAFMTTCTPYNLTPL